MSPHSLEALSHDARNLLTALGLYAELLSAPGVLSERYRHYAGELRLLAERSSALVGDLCERAATAQATSRPAGQEFVGAGLPVAALVGSGAGEVSRLRDEPVCDAAAVLRRFRPLLSGLAGGSAEVLLRLASDLPPLPVSAQSLERVTANLVGNAVSAIRSACPGPRAGVASAAASIWVTLDARDGEARLSVEDSGPGMPPAVAAALVHARAAAPGRSGRVGRRGLGHPIVQGLVAESGGRLSVRPRAGGGTVITVRWTLASTAALRTYGVESVRKTSEGVLAC